MCLLGTRKVPGFLCLVVHPERGAMRLICPPRAAALCCREADIGRIKCG